MTDNYDRRTVHHAGAEECERALQRLEDIFAGLSGSLREMLSFAAINGSFISEMIESNDENVCSVTNIHEQLQGNTRLSEEIASSANTARERTKEAASVASDVDNTMKDVTSSLQEMEQQFASVRRLFEQVGNASKRISETVKEIEDISEQTHLLSLNAAIEAARAGEHGRGFGVVASEVKKLSERSRSLTNTIGSLLQTLETDMETTSESLSGFEQTKNRVSEQVGVTQEKITQSSESLREAQNTVEGIANSAANQSANADRITDDMATLQQSFQVVASSSKHIRYSLEQQRHTEENLKKLQSRGRTIVRENEARRERVPTRGGEAGDRSQGAASRVIRVGHDIAYPPWVQLREGVSAGLSVNASDYHQCWVAEFIIRG